MTKEQEKRLKRNSTLYSYLLQKTANKSLRKFEEYSIEELINIYREEVKKDYDSLQNLK